MKNTKLIRLLRTFSKEEFRNFEKFIQSPYFRKRDVTLLFNVLKAYYPGFDKEELNEAFIFEKTFPGKKFDIKADSLMKTLMSDLFMSCREYLIQLEMKEKPEFRKYFLMEQLRKRKIETELLKEAGASEKDNETGGFEYAHRLLMKFFLSTPMLAYSIDRLDYEKSVEIIISQNEYLAAAAVLKSLMFTDQKITAVESFNLKIRYNFCENFSSHIDFKGMIQEMKKNNDKYTPYIEIYYYAHLMKINFEDEKNFFKFKELLVENEKTLSHTEKYMMYGIATGYCNEKVSLGDRRYRKEIVLLYKKMLKLGVYKYSPKDYFQVSLFRSMLIDARVNGEFEWMKELINNYSHELNPDYKDSMISYAYGQYFYAIGEFGKALESLIKLKSDYFLYKKDHKNLLFRIYYELKYFEEAFSVLDSLRHYFANTTDLPAMILSRGKNFIKHAEALLKIRTGNDFKNASYLRKKVTEEIDITESYEWLIEKAKEMEKMSSGKR